MHGVSFVECCEECFYNLIVLEDLIKACNYHKMAKVMMFIATLLNIPEFPRAYPVNHRNWTIKIPRYHCQQGNESDLLENLLVRLFSSSLKMDVTSAPVTLEQVRLNCRLVYRLPLFQQRTSDVLYIVC